MILRRKSQSAQELEFDHYEDEWRFQGGPLKHWSSHGTAFVDTMEKHTLTQVARIARRKRIKAANPYESIQKRQRCLIQAAICDRLIEQRISRTKILQYVLKGYPHERAG